MKEKKTLSQNETACYLHLQWSRAPFMSSDQTIIFCYKIISGSIINKTKITGPQTVAK